jgi:hypothetical protein
VGKLSHYDVQHDLDTVQGRLYYARAGRYLTRSIVAKAFGCRSDTIKNWERKDNGTRSVPLIYLRFAAVAFGVSEAWLLGETHDLPFPRPHKQTESEKIWHQVHDAPGVAMQRRLRAHGPIARWPKRPSPAQPATTARSSVSVGQHGETLSSPAGGASQSGGP